MGSVLPELLGDRKKKHFLCRSNFQALEKPSEVVEIEGKVDWLPGSMAYIPPLILSQLA